MDELLPDHALAADERDLFDHEDYVERLQQVIEHVSVAHTSANVALYGPWGSGKSGIANRLRARLATDSRYDYADFDAFKFGRRPLLRNFIRRLAEQLFSKQEATRYKRPLYEATSRPHLSLPRQIKLSRNQWAVYLALCVVLGFLLGSWVFDQGRLHEIASRLLPTGLLIAVVLGGLRYFTTIRTTTPAESDEEFEEIFRRMLRRLKIDGRGVRRLVVFIDELDRCAPDEVATTLESLRTFLGVKGCIFIVAADQHVLEHALTRHLRQATPPDLANPYYSAGSAYLDKIFQYQLSFPPLRPRRLNHYALELLEGRGGVWADRRIDREDIVSVLLPTHIHSPRRVKVLLNGFALTFGIAQARAKRTNLPEPSSRAAELAKLVCLKLEFPLFARELVLDDRLTDAVVLAACAHEGDEAAHKELAMLPDEVQNRAFLYASGQLPAAQLLSNSSDDRPVEEVEVDESDQDAAGADGEVALDGAEFEPAEEASVQGRHAVQLVRYLEKTASVPGPHSDLIHLESAGAVWGLDPRVAEALERDARDNRLAAVAERLGEIEEEMRPKALLMLARLAREEVGRDAENAIRALLAAVSATGAPPPRVAQQLVGDLAVFEKRHRLSDGDLPGALDLALSAGEEALAGRLLGYEEFSTLQNCAFHALSRARELQPAHSARLAEILGYCARTDAARTHELLDGIEWDQLSSMLIEAAPGVGGEIESEFERVEQLVSEGLEGDAAESHTLAENGVAELSGLAGLFLENGEQRLAELTALPLFAVDRRYGRDARFAFLAGVDALSTEELTAAVLGEIDAFGLERTLAQLRVLDPDVLAGIEDAAAALGRLAAHIWSERTTEGREIEAEMRAEVERLIEAGIRPVGDVAHESMRDDLVRVLATEADLSRFDVDESLAFDMSEVGLVPLAFVATCSIRTVALSIAAPAPGLTPEGLVHSLRGSIAWIGGWAEADVVEEALRVLREESWLPENELFQFELLLLAALSKHGGLEEPSLADLRAATEEGRAGQESVGTWIANFAHSPSAAFAAAAPFVDDPSEELCEGLSEYAAGLGPRQLAQLSALAIEQAFAAWPSESFFEAADLARADDLRAAHALVGLVKEAGNPDQRRLVLDIWGWLGPTSRKARKLLIEQVFLPIASAGVTGHELARQRLELVAGSPSALRDTIVATLRDSAPDARRATALESRLQQVGLVKKKEKKGIVDRIFGRSESDPLA